MRDPHNARRKWLAWAVLGWLLLVLFDLPAPCPRGRLWAQESTTAGAQRGSNPRRAADAAPRGMSRLPAADSIRVNEQEGINFFALLLAGGWFMAPIGLLSLLVVTVAIERSLGLRQARVLPEVLVEQLGRLGAHSGSFDPREAYRVCQLYPSAAASVVRAMLLKLGRPQSEVEHAVAEASEREAERLYASVRWLNLAAGVAPLLGLLGTVWGMIEAFHRTSTLAPGQNRTEELATGIYIALVTTLGGLMVAIPAAMLSHLFEGRIQKRFHQVDELLLNLLPHVERFEGRMRFGQSPGDGLPVPSPPDPPQVAVPPQRSER